MGTYADLVARVATEIQRSGMDDTIKGLIAQAIRYYRKRRTSANTGQRTAATVASEAVVDTPDGLRKLDRLAVVVGGLDYELDKITAEDMAARVGAATGFSGQPCEFSWEEDGFHLWPIPGEVYTLRFNGVWDEDALVEDDDESFWTNDGQDLIAYRAKMLFARDISYDPEMEASATRAMREAAALIFTEAGERTATGKLQANW